MTLRIAPSRLLAPARAPAAAARRARGPAPTRAGKDFDAVLADFAETFEAYPNEKKASERKRARERGRAFRFRARGRVQTVSPPFPPSPPPQAAVVGWGVGAVIAFIIAERVLHAPGLDILLGVPVQALGIVALPALIVRYALDKGHDWQEDATAVLKDVARRLPGLDV
jgi:hypothetical protein